MTAVFISYRRDDSRHFTGRMYDRLRAELGRDAVFKDVDSIPPGSDFPTILRERLGRCRVALVVVGRGWVTAEEPDGTRRLDNPNDFVRLEVETVLGRGIPVIPVLVDGAGNLLERDLPDTLHALTRRHTVEVGDDPRFDADMNRLTRHLQQLLAEDAAPPEPPPAAPAPRPAPVVESPQPPPPPPPRPVERPAAPAAVVGRDRAWPEIARLVAKGARRVVLTGPRGIGKRTTAVAFARWHSPAAAPLVIDAREEFYELSLVEAVGRAYPDELHRDHDGSPFVALSFGTQRQIAIDILARHKAAVVFDGAGEAEYPRDADAEITLARRFASELADRGVLAVVTAEHPAGWADWNPVALQGLSPENARGLLLRDLGNQMPPLTLGDLAAKLGGPAAVDALIARGHPGELLRAVGELTGDRPRGDAGLGRVARPFRDLAALLLGDPVRPRPKAGRAAGPGPLFIVCVGLLFVAAAALVWSYESGSALWERMFYALMKKEADVPPLPAEATKVSPGPGWLIEFARASIVIIFFFLVVIGRFFADELAALVPHAPWARVGPRTLGLRAVFRLMFLALAAWLGYSTVVHHLHTGPRILWMCNGNPFLQRHLEARDAAKIRELQALPADDRGHMNAEPPAAGDPEFDRYWRECRVPYLRYYPYSFVMFVLVGPTVLTVCFYSVCSSLWTHLTQQPRQIEQLSDRTPRAEVENRFRYYKATYERNADKYLILLLILLGCWAYHLWLDRYNLTESADDHTTRILIVALVSWAALFAALLLAYQVLVREAGKRFPEGDPRDNFERRHGTLRFFTRTVLGSAYSWLCLVPLAIGGAWYALAALGGWQR